MAEQFGFKDLSAAVAGYAAALRCITEYQPAGGIGDKVFPPTYEGGRYATETRVLEGGEIADCVLFDSIFRHATAVPLRIASTLFSHTLIPCWSAHGLSRLPR